MPFSESYCLGKRRFARQDEPHWANLIDECVLNNVGKSSTELQDGFNWIKIALKSSYPTINDFGDGQAGNIILQTLIERS